MSSENAEGKEREWERGKQVKNKDSRGKETAKNIFVHRDDKYDYSSLKLSQKSIDMCNICFWNTYRTTTVILPKENHSYVFTGDLDDMWIRDSSAQVHSYIPFARKAPKFQRLIEGLLRRQAMYINYDPYANSYRIDTNYKFSEEQKALGRYGYVATFNYELDSGLFILSSFVLLLFYLLSFSFYFFFSFLLFSFFFFLSFLSFLLFSCFKIFSFCRMLLSEIVV